ncbi:MAG: tetratricopeptide repeat protein [Candidatus Hodarchaeales archaeon]
MSNSEERKSMLEALIEQRLLDKALETVENFLSTASFGNNDYNTLVFLKGRILYENHSYDKVIEVIHPLLTDKTLIKDLILKVDFLLLISRSQIESAQYKEGLAFLQEGEEILNNLRKSNADKIGNRFFDLENLRGTLFFYMTNYDRSRESFKKGLAHAEAMNDDECIGASLVNIANVDFAEGSYNQALDYYYRCLKIKKKTRVEYWESGLYSNIALILEIQGELDLALEYQKKSLVIREKMIPPIL